MTKARLMESATLARGAAHTLSVLAQRHPNLDDARLALRCAIELEVRLTGLAAEFEAGAATSSSDVQPGAIPPLTTRG
jgi:hypothetical protein